MWKNGEFKRFIEFLNLPQVILTLPTSEMLAKCGSRTLGNKSAVHGPCSAITGSIEIQLDQLGLIHQHTNSGDLVIIPGLSNSFLGLESILDNLYKNYKSPTSMRLGSTLVWHLWRVRKASSLSKQVREAQRR